MKKHILAASLLMASLTSFGAGYQLNLEGLRQVAMGGTGVAWPWDASTIFYNPGGLARLKGIQVYGSLGLVIPTTAYSSGYSSATSVHQTFTPFNIYIGGPLKEGSKFALGLGVYTPAGLGLEWKDDWTGRYLVQTIQLKAVFVQPTVSYRINDMISVGAGFVYANGVLDFRQALPISTPDYDTSSAHLHGNATGVGVNAGVQIKISDRLQLGATYRSQVNMDLSGGTATFVNVPVSLRSNFPNTQFSSSLPIPQVASIGIGYRTGPLTLQFDLNFTGWNSYDSLRFDFSTHTSSLQDNHQPRHYRNTLTPRIGGNYKISKVVSVMLGGAYDPTPVTSGYVSPDLPDADRIVVSAGISIKPLPGFTILAAYEATSTMKRHATYDFGGFNGTYQTQAATPGIGITYNF